MPGPIPLVRDGGSPAAGRPTGSQCSAGSENAVMKIAKSGSARLRLLVPANGAGKTFSGASAGSARTRTGHPCCRAGAQAAIHQEEASTAWPSDRRPPIADCRCRTPAKWGRGFLNGLKEQPSKLIPAKAGTAAGDGVQQTEASISSSRKPSA